MTDELIAIAVFAAYASITQWTFRCQRVGRGILLVAKDTASGQRQVLSQIMPTRYVAAVWIGRLLWLGSAFFAWRAWGWYGLAAIVAYGLLVGGLVDGVSPWPSYSKLLDLFRERIRTGKAGPESMSLLPTVRRIEEAMNAGANFEQVTYGTWLGRAGEAARRKCETD